MATATLENMAPPVSALGRLPDWGVRREGSAGREISMGLIGTHQARDDLEGRCGFFERRRKWTVDPPEAGVIIQLITRSFDVSEWTGSSWRKMSGAEIDAYATTRRSAPYATVLQYWELWEVSSSGGVSDGNEDTFSLCAIIPPTATTDHQMRNTTRGSFVITGHARFYAYGRGRVTPESLGFTRGSVAVAGTLYATSTDPQPRIDAAVMDGRLVARGNAVGYEVTANWDSAVRDTYTNVTARGL